MLFAVSKRPGERLLQTRFHTLSRVIVWTIGTTMALLQSSSYRHFMTADAISYIDMSDAVLPGFSWSRLVTGVWSPLYPFLIGVVRRIFRPSPYAEIEVSHYFNIAIFWFALFSFEFLLKSMEGALQSPDPAQNDPIVAPPWLWRVLAYSLFLWVSITQITLQTLRPDMLMSAFVYLAIGMITRIKDGRSLWRRYFALGLVLGIGYLVKAPILPLGMVILVSSLFAVKNWKHAFLPAGSAALLMLLVGSCYFLPLSRQRGHLTFGESASFNYLYHVDRASPTWYLQAVGGGTGHFEHVPRRIYDNPPAYEFRDSDHVTHALRFDPSNWTQGAHARFDLRRQLSAIHENIHIFMPIFSQMSGLLVGFIALAVGAKRRTLLHHWQVWFTGVIGLAMYTAVHVESRYIGVFLALVWLGLFASLQSIGRVTPRLVTWVVLGAAISLFVPVVDQLSYDFSSVLHPPDSQREVARQLSRLGLHPGDTVARISPEVTDLGWARVGRLSIVAETEWELANHFWTSDPEGQSQALRAFADTGAKGVVAHSGSKSLPHGWLALGDTGFWLYPLTNPGPD